MPKKIKLLHILPNLSRAGAEKVVYDLLLNLDEEKFTSNLLLFKENGSSPDWSANLEAHNIKVTSLRKRCLFDLMNFWRIYRKIKKLNPDIIHTHLGGDIYGRLAGRLAGVKLIVSTEHNLNFRERSSAAWLKKLSARYANKIFAVSEAVKTDAIKRYQLPPDKLAVVYNGIDLNVFKTTEVEARRPLIIGSLGRLNKQKGFSVLINAVKQTRNKDYKVKIAGAGELEEELKDLIFSSKLEERVELVGLAEPVGFINNLDIFVVPSLWEGLGLVALEAAAMKKPIIASTADGLTEIINNDNGFLFPVGDTLALAEKIDYVIDNFSSPEVSRKAALARQAIEDKFSLEKMTESYSTWYKNLLAAQEAENNKQ